MTDYDPERIRNAMHEAVNEAIERGEGPSGMPSIQDAFQSGKVIVIDENVAADPQKHIDGEYEYQITYRDIIEGMWDAANWHIHENPHYGEDDIIKMDWVGAEYMSQVTISGQQAGVQSIVKEFVKEGWHAERDHSRDIFTAIVTPQ